MPAFLHCVYKMNHKVLFIINILSVARAFDYMECEQLICNKGSYINTPKVCYTPDGEPGECVHIEDCPHLSEMLKPPLSRPDNLNYVRNSKCTENWRVCCGPPRDLEDEHNMDCRGNLSAYPPDPATQCCGREASYGNKISGGDITVIDQYPWIVLIEYWQNGKPTETLCSGFLISGRYVVTAAHCVIGNILSLGTPKNVIFSEYDKTTSGIDCSVADGGGLDCNQGTITIPIEEIIPHPFYNTQARTSKNDIALIRLNQFVPYTDFIRPICLPTKDYTNYPPADYNLWMAGWETGSPFKMDVKLLHVSLKDCEAAYRADGHNYSLWPKQICAGGHSGKDSCPGDSGAPLMYQNPVSMAFEAIGVVSFGYTRCGYKDLPGVYTYVFEYIEWIRNEIR